MDNAPNYEGHVADFSPDKIRVLVFDVDDTLTRGTQDIKIEMWDRLFSDKTVLLQEAIELYEHTGKGDRYNMIAHVLGEPQADCKENYLVQEWADKFEQMTQGAIRERGIHPDDLKMLIGLKDKFPEAIYLLSATPIESVEGNIRYFESIYPELEGVFSSVIGTPMTGGKAGELMLIAENHGLEVNQLVMIGDGGSDYSGAKGSGTQFIAIVPEGKLDKWPKESFPKLASISELPDVFLYAE